MKSTCSGCAQLFEYEAGRGRPRTYCDECRRIDPRRRRRAATVEPRPCVGCGALMPSPKPNQRFCSGDCRKSRKWANRPRLACSTCGEPTGWTSRASVDPKVVRCRKCIPLAPCGTVASYARGCRCEECRAANTAATREYVAKRKAEGRPIVKASKTNAICTDCNVHLPTGPGKGEGPPRCGDCGRKSRQRAARMQRRRERAELLCAQSAAGSRGGSVWTQGACGSCGAAFVSARGAGFCSKRCREKSRSSTKWITPRRRRAIYERDGWTCQLCHEPVDREAHYLDDWSASLDHIEPRSHSLIPDHGDENLRTAHRWCNSVRGDETYYTAMDLVAA